MKVEILKENLKKENVEIKTDPREAGHGGGENQNLVERPDGWDGGRGSGPLHRCGSLLRRGGRQAFGGRGSGGGGGGS